jgi:hypothetical protein
MPLYRAESRTGQDRYHAATNAAILGIEKTGGTMEKGKLADLIAVPGDPLKDISKLHHAEFVMQEGRIARSNVEGEIYLRPNACTSWVCSLGMSGGTRGPATTSNDRSFADACSSSATRCGRFSPNSHTLPSPWIKAI